MSKRVQKLEFEITDGYEFLRFCCERCERNWTIEEVQRNGRTIFSCPWCGYKQDFSDGIDKHE